MTTLMNKVNSLPSKPGCYIYRNKYDHIIYVGKSKCLKKRVHQYFQSPDKKEGKIQNLVREIYDLDYIVTETETDALLLECKLIKEYRPHYNSMMKNNRTYPFIKISCNKDYPGIFISNDSKEEEDVVSFGCFYNVEDAEKVIDLINQIWRTPLCKKKYFDMDSKSKACFYFHIGKCDAPCSGNISADVYNSTIKEVIKFLSGKNKKKISEIKKEMIAKSRDLEFEKAAVLRNQMTSLEKLQRRTKKFNTNLKGKDYCVFLRAYNEPCFSIFYIHDGLTLLRITLEISDRIEHELIESFSADILSQKFNVEDEEIMSLCITSIGADKLYVDVTQAVKRKNQKLLAKRIFESYNEFYE